MKEIEEAASKYDWSKDVPSEKTSVPQEKDVLTVENDETDILQEDLTEAENAVDMEEAPQSDVTTELNLSLRMDFTGNVQVHLPNKKLKPRKQKFWCQHLVAVSSSVHVATDDKKPGTCIATESTKHHDTSASKSVNFLYTTLGQEEQDLNRGPEHDWSASKSTENTLYLDNPEERSPSQNLPSEISAQETVNPETQPLTVSEDRNISKMNTGPAESTGRKRTSSPIKTQEKSARTVSDTMTVNAPATAEPVIADLEAINAINTTFNTMYGDMASSEGFFDRQ
ncbi:uncharacterized protein [Haliotis cracherodii]|uniref:uncharacterized protein n=1 Tax=Haliotis cracherodii TaxID=6455 RepID=UPI0039ED1480